MIGQTISHYKITKKLGAGGMGVVCITENDHLFRHEVAVEVLPNVFTADKAREVSFSIAPEFVAR